MGNWLENAAKAKIQSAVISPNDRACSWAIEFIAVLIYQIIFLFCPEISSSTTEGPICSPRSISLPFLQSWSTHGATDMTLAQLPRETYYSTLFRSKYWKENKIPLRFSCTTCLYFFVCQSSLPCLPADRMSCPRQNGKSTDFNIIEM